MRDATMPALPPPEAGPHQLTEPIALSSCVTPFTQIFFCRFSVLLSGFRRFSFGDAGAAQYVRDHVVAFMASPLEHRSFCFRPRNLRGPRLGPRGGIFSRKLVKQRIVRNARETFHQMQLFAGSLESAQFG